MLGLDARGEDRVDLFIGRPDVLELHGIACGVDTQHVLFDVEADRAGNRIRHHQRRRSEEGLLGIWVDPAVEVAVAGQHGGGVQIALDDFLLDHRIERARHTVARRAGIRDDPKAELLQFRQQLRFFQIQGHGFRSRRERALHPRLAGQAALVCVACQEPRGNHVARVVGVGAARDRGDDHGAIRHQPRLVLDFAADTTRGQFGHRQTAVRVRRACQRANHRRQVELQHALVLRVLQAVGPKTGLLRVRLHQLDEFIVTAGQLQVLDGLLVDVEHRGRRTEFRRHIGDRGAVTQREIGRACAIKLQIRADHLFLAQEFGQRQHHVRGRNALGGLAGEFDADDIRQAHIRGAPQHHAFGFETAHADRDHAERIHHRRMRIRAH